MKNFRLLLKHQYQRDAVHTEEQAEQFEAAVEYYLDIFNCDKTKKEKDPKSFRTTVKIVF